MKRKHIYTALVMLLMPVLAGAQALKGSYFLDNSMDRHRMNPAFTPRSDYFQLPVIGSTGVGVVSNLDIPTFLYPSEGQLLSFLHRDVSIETFSKSLPQHPHLDTEFNTTLLSFGFYSGPKSYWTFDLSTRVLADIDLPRDLFLFLKQGTGTSGRSFNIGNINAYVSAAVQASLGYSREITKGLRAGAKVRFIAPVAYAGLNFENVRLNTDRESWNLTTEGYLNTAMPGLDISNSNDNAMISTGFDLNKMLSKGCLAGWGFSYDLGLEYKYEMEGAFNGFTVAASVTDLGAIFYTSDSVNSFALKGSLDWNGFQDVSMNNTDFEAALDDFVSRAEKLLSVDELKSKGSMTKFTMPSVYAGVDVPFLWNTMSLSLLYSARFSHSYARQELTASYNLKPCKWFALGVNWSFLNTAQTMGFILEFTPKVGPTLYIGTDYMPMAFAKAPLMDDSLGTDFPDALGLDGWYLPMGLRLNVNFGMSFTLGSKYGR